MRSLDEHVEVETPEQVMFAHTIAGLGSRSAAAIIDYLICIVLWIAMVLLGASAIGATAMLNASGFTDWIGAIVLLSLFAILYGYHVLFEGLADGQTPGKKLFHLRVVQDGGYSVSFAASAVRNLVRIVDMLPGPYAVGMLTVMLSRSSKRLGDHAAGTIVIHERMTKAPVLAGVASSDGAAMTSAALTDGEYELLERYLARRSALDEERRALLDLQMTVRLGDRLPADVSNKSEAMIRLYGAERDLRSRGVASRSDKGAAREQHSIVAAGAERWNSFATLLADIKRRGISKLTEEEVAGFVARYRELSTDLARLRTAARGRDSESAFYLSRLVAAGHNLLYKQRQMVPLLAWNFIAVTVPREVRRSWGPIALAALALFGPMVVTHFVLVQNPAVADLLLPEGMIERADGALEREREGGGYLPDEIAESRGAGLSSMLMTNNVRVAFVAFAFGISAGVGTLLVLFMNGLSIGAAFGLFQTRGALHLIMGFVGPHGVLELSAICIAGGAGLVLGSAFILPGAHTRREALVIRARRAIRLVAAAGLLLIVAGIIEGFVSPLHLRYDFALLFGALTAVPMLLYFQAGRSGDAQITEEFGYSDERALSSR